MSDDTIEKIKAELFRLHARPEDVGIDGIVVGGRHYGALLGGAHAGIAGRLDALEADLAQTQDDAESGS